MKASELIDELNYMIATHGNLDVKRKNLCGDYGEDHYDVMVDLLDLEEYTKKHCDKKTGKYFLID